MKQRKPSVRVAGSIHPTVRPRQKDLTRLQQIFTRGLVIFGLNSESAARQGTTHKRQTAPGGDVAKSAGCDGREHRRRRDEPRSLRRRPSRNLVLTPARVRPHDLWPEVMVPQRALPALSYADFTRPRGGNTDRYPISFGIITPCEGAHNFFAKFRHASFLRDLSRNCEGGQAHGATP